MIDERDIVAVRLCETGPYIFQYPCEIFRVCVCVCVCVCIFPVLLMRDRNYSIISSTIWSMQTQCEIQLDSI